MFNIKKTQIPLLLFSLILPQIAGFIGSIFTISAIPIWYQSLVKPPIAPPNWVFAPVWTTLYLLMGASFFLVARKKKSEEKSGALKFYYKQLILNALWSIAFFGLRSPLLGLIVIIPLVFLIFQTIIKFSKISSLSGKLMWPYLVWVSFATILNLWFFLLN